MNWIPQYPNRHVYDCFTGAPLVQFPHEDGSYTQSSSSIDGIQQFQVIDYGFGDHASVASAAGTDASERPFREVGVLDGCGDNLEGAETNSIEKSVCSKKRRFSRLSRANSAPKREETRPFFKISPTITPQRILQLWRALETPSTGKRNGLCADAQPYTPQKLRNTQTRLNPFAEPYNGWLPC